MGPIELFYLAIAIMILLIGLARRYVKELGSSLVLMSAVFIIGFVYARGADWLFETATSLVESIAGTEDTQQTVELLLSSGWSLLFILVAFSSYAGVTLDFPGKGTGGLWGRMLDVFVGALNGYLIAGTLWFIQDVYQYPIQYVFEPTLTDTAQKLVDYLPPVVFPTPAYWVIPVAVLLIWVVRK
jgi:hypothetical protein